MDRRSAAAALLTGLAAVTVLPSTTASATASPAQLPVLDSGLVTEQDIPSQPGSEPDTVVEPDVAVDPAHPDVAIAAAHDSRFPDGGAVDISAARTADGGATWQHQAVAGITKARGGAYDRASDPVVAFGPDGTAYLSVLAVNLDHPCPDQASAVLVLTSSDGGRTWSRPNVAVSSATCAVSEDKNWLVVDTWPKSPHVGRVYQFWTPFLSDAAGNVSGAPQAVRWSDDHAATWSETSYISPIDHATQNSQPMITASGAIVDTYYDFGVASGEPLADPADASADSPARDDSGRAPKIIDNRGDIVASRSDDGGATWQQIALVAANGGGFAPGVRCCLFAADIDRTTGILYVAFHGAGLGNTDPVFLAASPNDGSLWTNPVQVSQGDEPGIQRVNVDVVAQGGSVYVSYGTRMNPDAEGGTVQQQISVSRDRGTTFGAPQSIGPVSVLKYAARSEGFFPGDYIGEAIADGRLYVVFARSSAPPPSSSSRFHQVIWGVTLHP
jgi:BNR repeat-like domain